MNKPLGQKAYGHIPHLPGSRIGPGDHKCHEGQARICLEKPRDKHDVIIVQEKLDGGCVSVALLNGEILALGRAGYLARSSKYVMHHLFAGWVKENEARFRAVLDEGERIVGEWLICAHGTRYNLKHEPFVAFDIMRGHDRMRYRSFIATIEDAGFIIPRLLWNCGVSFPIAEAKRAICKSGHGAIDSIEGAVWRVERKGEVDFLAKWVRPEKVDGLFLAGENEEGQEVWNKWPTKMMCPACHGTGRIYYDGEIEINIGLCLTCFGTRIKV